MPLNFYSPPPKQQSIFTPGTFILCTVALAAVIVNVVSQLSDDEDSSFMLDSLMEHFDESGQESIYGIDFNYWK